jgi:hypothetical protein
MFGDMQKEIERVINERKLNGANYQGVIVSKPGTEKVVLSTSIADFMTCEAIGNSPKAKDRFCIVHKDGGLKFNGQYCNSSGLPVSIITKAAFDTIVAILSSTSKTISELRKDLDRATVEKESMKMTLDALRRNGVID